MPTVSVFIRKEDLPNWRALENKSTWLHDNLPVADADNPRGNSVGLDSSEPPRTPAAAHVKLDMPPENNGKRGSYEAIPGKGVVPSNDDSLLAGADAAFPDDPVVTNDEDWPPKDPLSV